MNYPYRIILSSVFLLILLQSKVFAQAGYVPFPESDAVWTVYHDEPYELINDNAQYMLVGDTQINGLTYNKLSSKDEYLGNIYDYGIVGILETRHSAKKGLFSVIKWLCK